MDIFDKLISASANRDKLSDFLEENIQELYDFLLTKSFEDLSTSKDRIENYILRNLKVIKSLDFTIESTSIFVTLLLDVSERFGFLSSFEHLYKLLTKKECEIVSRLDASSLYLIGIKNIKDYSNKIESILDKLSDSYDNEEDTEDRVVGTIVNFYAQVVYNFSTQNLPGVQSIKEEILSHHTKFLFLKNNLITTVFSLDVTDNISAHSQIQELLDNFLKRTKKHNDFIRGYLIEKNTYYSSLLKDAKANFNSVRQISVDEYKKIQDESIFKSLQRGVKVLTNENELYTYLNSYGRMHYEKMTTSFAFIPKKLFNNKIDIIDWGCGQGLASISFFEYFKNNINMFNSVTLIEPSELALKRASLHVKKFNKSIDILTINKYFDSLTKEDFTQDNYTVKVHLFSNILDIDLFSLTQLVGLIKKTFEGENYFVCASPFVHTLKTSRLNSFVKSFSTNNNFNHIKEINEQKDEWINSWTRVIRIFKVDI